MVSLTTFGFLHDEVMTRTVLANNRVKDESCSTLELRSQNKQLDFWPTDFQFKKILEDRFKKLPELATLIDIRNPFFTRKIKKLNMKLMELETCNFWLKKKKLLEIGPSPGLL